MLNFACLYRNVFQRISLVKFLLSVLNAYNIVRQEGRVNCERMVCAPITRRIFFVCSYKK